MDIILSNFITRFLEHPQTFIHVNINTIIDGFALKNNDFNIQLNIFSDKYNGAYLELIPINSLHKQIKFYPNYRFDNYNELIPFINLILDKLDSQNTKDKYVPEHIKNWRRVLKEKNLSDGITLEENSYALYLKKDGFQLSTLEKKYLNNRLSSSWASQEPLCLVKIPFSITQHKPSHEQFIFYIPKYGFKNYPLLNQTYDFDVPLVKEPSAKYKRNNYLSNSLEDWINKLMAEPEIRQLGILNLMRYEELSQSLSDENNLKVKKIKL